MAPDASSLPRFTRDLPGTGGRIKDGPDDFIVDEIPLYLPTGKGTHLYLLIEKRNVTTFRAIQLLAKRLGRKQRDFGVAGLKDAAATTRQYVSIEHVAPEEVDGLELPGIKIVDRTLHGNKLKRGHLKGNRFSVVIRDPSAGSEERAREVLRVLARRGVPNYFGPQRFGVLKNTHRLGRALLLGDYRGFADELIAAPRESLDPHYERVIALYRSGDFKEAAQALRPSFEYERRFLDALHRTAGDCERASRFVDRRVQELYLSAYQSDLFNKVVAARIDGIDRVMEGDAAFIHRNGACFLVDDAVIEQPRAESFEISPSGPLFGSRLLRAAGVPGKMEDELLLAESIDLAAMSAARHMPRGARRPLRVPLTDVEAAHDDTKGLCLKFSLPPGSYATVVLDEIMKETSPPRADGPA